MNRRRRDLERRQRERERRKRRAGCSPSISSENYPRWTLVYNGNELAILEDEEGNEILFLFWTEEDAKHARQWFPLPENPPRLPLPENPSPTYLTFGVSRGQGKSHFLSHFADFLVVDEAHQGLPTTATPNFSFFDKQYNGTLQSSNAPKLEVVEVPFRVLKGVANSLLNDNVREVRIPLRGARSERNREVPYTRMSMRHFLENELKDTRNGRSDDEW